MAAGGGCPDPPDRKMGQKIKGTYTMDASGIYEEVDGLCVG